MPFVKDQVCGSTKEELLESGLTVRDACDLCQDEGVQCRVGNHKSREAATGKSITFCTFV
eukprot:scaffold877_cov198-Ochromonas_danica.AAC.2